MSADSGCLDPDTPHDLDVTFENDTRLVGNCTVCGEHIDRDKEPDE